MNEVAQGGAEGTNLGACPVCACERRRRWFRHPRLTLWLCRGCGLGYSDPQPRAFVTRRYLEEYDLAGHFGELAARKETLVVSRLDRLPAPFGGRRLLDVGCADGQFASAAQGRGWIPTGVEMNPPAAKRAREHGIDVREGELENVDLPAAAYDIVTAWDVIEHVAEPGRFVQHLARAAAPGGLVIVTTLNRHALVARVFRGRWSMVVEDHFTYWDCHSLRHAFARTELRPISEMSFGLGRDFVGWIDRRSQSSATPDVAAQGSRELDSSWDTRPAVLAAERVVNRVLDAKRLGVGIELMLRGPGDGDR